ncbi:Regulatory protein BlaR1 [Anaerohalosphaera lusitana]|uniref:Regulatory protein BlaR1 n=1 Tax=Anaerohalosphaera lusitana TaxID=1936003 RepID=A0A1U9NQC7_9BACT|nr:M56 family metallopeptidase [Anaerohalosphaera lusitana]AQT69987.1 Regulatory protein BlaR1 [Anaerohalosphaera lusitana]
MSAILDIFTDQLIRTATLALAHSLWQGTVIALLLWLYLRSSRSAPATRYAVSFLAIIILAATPILTYSLISLDTPAPSYTTTEYVPRAQKQTQTQTQPQAHANGADLPAEPPISQNNGTNPDTQPASAKPAPAKSSEHHVTASTLTTLKHHWPRILFTAYILGVAAMLIRLLAHLTGTLTLKRSLTPDTDPDRNAVLTALASRARIARNITLALSNRVLVPCTVGLIKPVIILPASLITGLDENQLRAVLAHELMHIKRHDWICTILQMLIEALLFFNPATWWIGRQIRLEREAACDRSALSSRITPRDYARLLFDFASAHKTKAVAPAFSSANPPQLTERIKRLLTPTYRSAAIRPGIIPSVIVIAFFILAFVYFHKATESTLKYVGENLSPQQRAQTMQQISEDYSDNTSLLPEDQKITVSGTITTEDNKPLPNPYLQRL